MKITFVRPNLYDGRSSDAMEPLCFAILQGLTPPDVETVLYDERLEPVPTGTPTDLVAMTVETYTARRAYQIAKAYRDRGVPVVMGGYHPSFLPEEVARHADAVVQGDAEGLWPRIVADARAGQLQPLYRSAGFPPLAGLRLDRSIFHGKRYVPIGLVQYGRGCKFNCDFCSIRAFYGSNLRQRPIPELVAEIERLGHRHIFFVDDNIFVDVEKAKALFRALIPLKIKWSCQVSIDVVKDPELLPLMEKSGCLTALVGFESLNLESLREMKKGWNLKFGGYDDSVRRFQDAGVMIYGTFVFGYDHDTPAAFEEAVEFSIRHKFWLANFNPLTPTPGAPLYDRLAAEGRLIFDAWWTDPGFRYGAATFRPRGMTAEELTKGCYRARCDFNTWRSFGYRFAAPKTNLRSPHRAWIYWLANTTSRREIRSKQGRALGNRAPRPAPAEAL
jgi:radical SAM superfamily enzyme YgiQ (UPF0313 family)